MRLKALVLAAAACGSLLAFAGPTSAYCIETPVGCTNPCDVAARAYWNADATAGDALPDRQFNCPR